MNGLKVFQHEEFGEIGLLELDGKTYFPATKAAEALGYAKPHDAISRHCRYSVKHRVPHPQNPSKAIEMNFVPESDLYRLIVNSRLSSAERFERWVFDEVLPSIRKTGSYSILPRNYIEALEALIASEKEKARLAGENALIAAENADMKPKADYFDNLVDRNLLTNLRDTAKEFRMGQGEFVGWLVSRRYLYRDAGGALRPYSPHVRKGLFEMKEWANDRRSGVQALVTPRGRATFRLLLVQEGRAANAKRSGGKRFVARGRRAGG